MLSSASSMETSSQSSDRLSIENQQDQEESDGTDEEEGVTVTTKPRFLLVEMEQLEKLLQRCMNCGSLPGGRSTGHPRSITWKRKGTCYIAHYNCYCKKKEGGQEVNQKRDERKKWEAQTMIPNTETHVGNLAVVAAATVAPIAYVDLKSFFEALDAPLIAKITFTRLAKHYVFPAIEDYYYKQQADLANSLDCNVGLAIDGQYDSPGFSAEYCTVAAIEDVTKMVLDFAVVRKSETGGVSQRMELEGVKRVLDHIEQKVKVDEITCDKHSQVVSHLKKHGYKYFLDLWHQLKGTKKLIKDAVKSLKDDDEKAELQELGKRFINHIYYCVERGDDNTDYTKEAVFSFFNHVLGRHEWNEGKIVDVLPISNEEKAKLGKKFQKETFQLVTNCPYHQEQHESHHEPVDENSNAYKVLLRIASRNSFVEDLEHLKYGDKTAYVESFNSIGNKYRPKRKFYPLHGFEIRTMLAVLAFNENRRAELRGERQVNYVYRCYSKAAGEYRQKVKKGPVYDAWKKVLVEDAIENKSKQGKGDPTDAVNQEDFDDGVELEINPLDDIINLDSDSDDDF